MASMRTPIGFLLLSLMFLSMRPCNATALELKQPSIATWSIGNQTSTLIIYNISHDVQPSWGKVGQSSAGMSLVPDRGFTFSDEKIYVYGPKDLAHKMSANHHFISKNASSQGVLQGSVVHDSNAADQPEKGKMLSLVPLVSHNESEYKKKGLFEMDGQDNIYFFPISLLTDKPTCPGFLIFTPSLLESNPQCEIITGQKYKQMAQQADIRPRVGKINQQVYSFTEPDKSNSLFRVLIDPSLMGTNLFVRPLSREPNDLSKLAISLKNFMSSKVRKVKMVLQNKGESLVFLRLDCRQGGELFYTQQFVIQPNASQAFEAEASTSFPDSDIILTVTNPLTNSFTSFTRPVTIYQEESLAAFNIYGSLVEEKSSISPFIFAGVGAGAFCLLLGVGVVVYRRRKAKKEIKLDLEALKGSVMTSNPSQREFVDRIYAFNSVLPPVRIQKEKSATSTTLDSDNHSVTNETAEEPSQRKVPSLQDKLQFRQQLESLPEPPKFKPGHRRHVSTEPMLPEASLQFCESYKARRAQEKAMIKVTVQKLDEVRA